MPRIRSIWPTQWTDGAFLRLTPIERLLTLALRNIADDNGVFRLDPIEIKAQCLPSDDVDIESMIAVLSADDTRIVRVYSHRDQLYGQLRNFAEFQSPQKPKFRHPVPEPPQDNGTEWALNSNPGHNLDHSIVPVSYQDDTAIVPVSSGVEWNGVEWNGEELTPKPPEGATSEQPPDEPEQEPPATKTRKSKGPNAKKPRSFYELSFGAFWEAWPEQRRQEKAAALKWWIAKKPDAALTGAIIAKVEALKKTSAWADPQYIKHAHRWLKGECWEDPVVTQESAKTQKPLADRMKAWMKGRNDSWHTSLIEVGTDEEIWEYEARHYKDARVSPDPLGRWHKDTPPRAVTEAGQGATT